MARIPKIDNEPKIVGEATQALLGTALSWYSQNKDTKDYLKYVEDYFKKQKITASYDNKQVESTFGFLCRLVSNGAVLSGSNKEYFDSCVDKLKSSKKKKVVEVENAEPRVTIQDRIKAKASECIGELDGLLDDYILSKFKANTTPYGLMHSMEIKSVHVTHIVNHFKNIRSEFDEVSTTKDVDLKEGYSNFNKTDLKKIIAFCDSVITDARKITGAAAQNRKPRKRKVKSPTELVAKLNYQKDFAELKLESFSPALIVGLSQMFVYNTKTKKLGLYVANDSDGLSVKGSSLTNYSETKSIQKTLRKPAVTIKEVVTGGKVALRNIMPSLTTKDAPLTGRINGDTILLKAIK